MSRPSQPRRRGDATRASESHAGSGTPIVTASSRSAGSGISVIGQSDGVVVEHHVPAAIDDLAVGADRDALHVQRPVVEVERAPAARDVRDCLPEVL